MLLVERSAYSVDLRPQPVTQLKPTAKSVGNKGKGRAAGTVKVPIPKDYAAAHGVSRGGTSLNDDLPAEGDNPVIDAEAEDEGLLAFVQARSCRRRTWAEVFESRVQRKIIYIIKSICCLLCRFPSAATWRLVL